MRRAIEVERRADRAELTKELDRHRRPRCCDRRKVSTGTMLDDAVILHRLHAALRKAPIGHCQPVHDTVTPVAPSR